MSERQRANPDRPEEFRFVVNIRRLQNRIGIAALLGIVFILVFLAFDPGSQSAPPATRSASTAPLTSVGDNVPLYSGMSSALLPATATSSTSCRRFARFTCGLQHAGRDSCSSIEVDTHRSSGSENIYGAKRNDTASGLNDKQYDDFDVTAEHDNDDFDDNDNEHDGTDDGPNKNGRGHRSDSWCRELHRRNRCGAGAVRRDDGPRSERQLHRHGHGLVQRGTYLFGQSGSSRDPSADIDR